MDEFDIETRLANIERYIYQIVITEKTSNDIIKREMDDKWYKEICRKKTKVQLEKMVELDREYAIQQQLLVDRITPEIRGETFIEALYGSVAPLLCIIILQWFISG